MSTKLSFSTQLVDKDGLKRLLDNTRTGLRGGPVLDQALIEAKKVFDGSGVRSNARKVCIDNKMNGVAQQFGRFPYSGLL